MAAPEAPGAAAPAPDAPRSAPAAGQERAPQTRPQSAPAPGNQPPGPERRPARPRGAPKRDPKAEEILHAVLAASGGEEYLRGIHSLFIRSRALRGEGETAEESVITQYWKAPNRYRREVDSPKGLFTMSYNGRYAWNDLGNGVTLAPKASYRDIEDVVRDINEPLSHLDSSNSLQYVGEQDLDGRKVDVILVTRPSGKMKRLYIDRESRRALLKEVSTYGEPEKIVARKRLSDYRQVDRLWVPFQEQDQTGEQPGRLELIDFIPNQAIDDRIFDSPVPPFDETPPPPGSKG